MCTAAEPTAPANTGQALAMLRAGLGYLADCDAGSLGTAAQAEALIGLERAEAQHTAARARILAAFTAQQGYEADGYYGPASWLRAITRVTKGAAAAATGWARRLDGHPVIAAALAAGQLPVSLARLVCDWTDKLPEGYRADADGILLAAVLGGADQHDLARLAREMLDRAQTSPDRDSDGFEERALWLGTTFGGAGRLHADLTPACAAALTVVLEALGQKAGPEDTRTAAQRRHDAIEEACRRLISGQLIPGRDGQPPHLTVHIDLNDLRGGSAGSVLERSWTPARAAAGPGSVYLTGPAAEAAACDAVLTTIVTGQIDWQVLDQLTTVWLTTHGHGHTGSPPDDHPAGPPESHPHGPRESQPEDHPDGPRESQPHGPRDDQPENHAHGPRDDHADGRKEDHAHGPRDDQPDGPRDDQAESQADDHPYGPREDHPDGPRDDQADGPRDDHRESQAEDHPDGQPDGRPESRDADQPAARTGHPPGSGPSPGSGPFHGYVPFPGTGHGPGPGPGKVPAAADDHDCGIAGCLEATRRRLQATILRWSLDLLSGPGGLASQLRGTVLGAPFNTLSQPLDLGRTTRTIPPHLRTAVIQRDQHCQFPRCTQPPSVCDVHHLIPWANGGPTSLANLRLLCRFHHLVVIHRWRWTITCHPDGTTTATAPDGRTLHSHGPPQQAA